MKAAEVWDVVSGTTPRPAAAADQPAWDKKDVEAQAILVPTLDKHQTNHVYSCATSKEMFDRLKDVNSDSSSLNKQHTLTSFLNYKIGSDQPIIRCYLDIEELARNLNEMGVAIDETTVVTKIVSSLPDDFLAFKKAWDSVPDTSQTMRMLLSRLRKEELEAKQKEKVTEESAQKSAAFAASSRQNGSKKQRGGQHQHVQQQLKHSERNRRTDELKKRTNCSKCGKLGHWYMECRSEESDRGKGQRPSGSRNGNGNFQGRGGNQYSSGNRTINSGGYQHGNANQSKNAGSKAFMALNSQPGTTSHAWISDSGATQHITGLKNWYEEYTEFENPKSVSLTDHNVAEALGVGTVQVEAYMQGVWESVTISNVLYIPGAVNLFSESQMAQKGYVIVRDQEKTIFYHNGETPGPEAWYKDQMYVMNFRPVEFQALSARTSTSKLWHDRMSHINIQYLRESVKKNAITGIDLNELADDLNCEECHVGKETRKPFPPVKQKHNTKPGEMIHADLSGKMPVPSLRGSNFFLLLKDNCTGFRTVYFIKHKTETAACIKDCVRTLECQTGNKVKTIKSDNGTEFVNLELKQYFSEMGIVHQTSAPYCPESNGRVEREMRTLKDTARTMMQQSGVPEFLWAEAIATTVYIHNRVLDKQSPTLTAFEQVFGKKPSMEHVRTFGCTAYAQVPKETRRVWDPKGKKHILVGYDSNSAKYRLYDATKRIIVTARNVSFLESKEKYATVSFQGHSSDNPAQDEDDDDWDENEDDQDQEDSESEQEHTVNPVIEVQPEKAGPGEQRVVPGPSNRAKTVTIVVKTPCGSYEAEIPTNRNTTVVVPAKRKTDVGASDRELRDRTTLKKPQHRYHSRLADVLEEPAYKPQQRYRANMARVLKEPASYLEAVSSDHSEDWIGAMEEEMISHQKNGTWELVQRPPRAKLLDSRWVFKTKQKPDGSIDRFKARLVIKGFKQQYGVDYSETFASVCRYESIRLMLAIAAAQGLQIKQFDVKTAFLYGELEEVVHMRQPEGYSNLNENEVCLLRKSLYGLKQAPRCWNQTFTQFLESFNFVPSTSDPCVYIGSENEAVVYLILYVDDGLLMSPKEEAILSVLESIQSKFEIKVSEASVFVGVEINRNEASGNMILTQTAYVNTILEKFNMADCKPASVPMQPNQNLELAKECAVTTPYRELIGSLIFLARTTRLDISYAASKLSQFTSCHDDSHWRAAKEVLRYLKRTAALGLEYKRNSSAVLSGYTDSDYAGDKLQRKSTSGFVFFLNDAVISWSSQKQPVVAVSSTEAEYVALAAGAREAIWLRKFLQELGYTQPEPTEILVDNQSAIKLAQNPEFHQRSKHIDVRFHFTRSLIEAKEIQVQYVPTEVQLADILTKPLLKNKHENMREMIGMVENEEPRSIKAGKAQVTKPRFKALWSFASFLLLIATATATFTTQSSQPLLWRPSKIPITTGHNRVNLKVKLVSPCEILTPDVLHRDVASSAIQRCNDMYASLFLNNLEKMCPRKDHRQLLDREKRVISLLIGLIIASIVVTVGIGTTGVAIASVNSGRISDVQAEVSLQQQKSKELENRVDGLESTVKDLRNSIDAIVTKMGNHENDFQELKAKQIATDFAISYVTTRLLLGESVLLEATRRWKAKQVYAPLLDFFKFQLPCGEECPISLASPSSCYLTDDRKELMLDFVAPVINRSLTLIEADPFQLMHKENNKTCTIEYTGPENMIVSTEKSCTFSINLKKPVQHDLILSPSHGCMPHASLPGEMKYFDVSRCEKEHDRDEWDFVQIKPFHGSNYVYCPGSKLELNGEARSCPRSVFLIPMAASFRINELDYKGSQVYLDHSEKIDPLFSLNANWHLQPHLNLTEVSSHPLLNDKEVNPKPDLLNHPMTWITVTCVIIICIIILVVLFLYYKYRNFNVTVFARHTNQGGGEEIELS